MTTEHTFLFEILSDFLHNESTKLKYNIDWASLYSLSKSHEVAGIVYHQCKEFLPNEYITEYRTSYMSAVYLYANRRLAMDQLSNALATKSISHFSIKGLEVAQFYPIPALRTMGDIDIVIEPRQMGEAIMLLRDMGFIEISGREEDTWVGNWKSMHYEIHSSLVKQFEYTSAKQVYFFNNYMPYVNNGHLDWSFHFIFLIMHLRKHFLAEGVGIRQFLDLAIIIRYGPELKWEWINVKLEELQLYKFAQTCYSLIYFWFGIIAPVEFEKLSEKTLKEVTEIVLENGVFGFRNAQNQLNKTRSAIIQYKGPFLLGRLRLLAHKVFPPYYIMRTYPGCTFLNDRKYLLPIAWLTRFIYILRNKDNASRIHRTKNIFCSDDDMVKQKELYDKLGL